MSAPFMQVYIADYTADVQHLTCEQDGAYWRLLRAMWRAGGELPNDSAKLARICGLTASRWAKIGPDVMALLTVSEGVVTQSRLAKEVEKANEKSSKRSEAGRIGGNAKSLKNNKPTLAIASDLPKHSLELELKEERTPLPPNGGEREDFESALKAFPPIGLENVGTEKLWAAWSEAIRSIPPDALLRAVREFAASDYVRTGGRPRRFDRWLNERAFEKHVTEKPLSATWCGPPEIRAAIVNARREPFAISWIDGCGWRDLPTKTITSTSPTVVTRLRQEVGELLAGYGVSIALVSDEIAA